MSLGSRGATVLALAGAWAIATLAQASFLWSGEAQGPTRIDTATAASGSVAGIGRVDTILPLADGGAWMRRGSELIRTAPDLSVAARASIALASAFHWDPQTR